MERSANKMIAVPGYQLGETIYDGLRTVVFRATRVSDGQRVILKTCPEDRLVLWQTAKYHHEYRILSSLNIDGILRAYGLEVHEARPVLVLEDFPGRPLNAVSGKRPLALTDILRIGAQAARIIGAIHEARVIHKDISPSNILFDSDTNDLRVIDFDMATTSSWEEAADFSVSRIQGTPSYMSPEQTGRTSRPIDFRTDYYSLGVTLYELITGSLPFASDDILELVHAHIAVEPKPPIDLNPNTFPVVSDLVLKLLAKNPDDRYQTAMGIRADLEECLRRLETTGSIEYFRLGDSDVSDKLIIPKKLYGRTKELTSLREALDRVDQGRKEIVLISGEAGIGKTALALQVNELVARLRGCFVTGKFDQYGRRSSSEVVTAFRDPVRRLLMENESRLSEWRRDISQALGTDAQALVDVIPELELIIGSPPAAPKLGPTESEDRFNAVFKSFVSLFARRSKPLALFLDDLQWADAASLRLLELLMADEQVDSFLCVGAYRDEEVSPEVGLNDSISRVSDLGVKVSRIRLRPLEQERLAELISDSVSCDSGYPEFLAEILVEKTRGNPFYAHEFIKSLPAQGLLKLDTGARRWICDVNAIRALESSDNVVEFMKRKLASLDPTSLQVLKQASCLGGRFDMESLTVACEQTPGETMESLRIATDRGLILPIGGTYLPQDLESAKLNQDATAQYKFCHDRIQQAAYTLIPDEDRPAFHKRIGDLLLNSTPEKDLEKKVFVIVDQLNQGISLVRGVQARSGLARLNLIAGKRALSIFERERAYDYLKTGLALLEDPPEPGDYYRLWLELHDQAALAAFLCGDFRTVDELSHDVSRYAGSALDTVNVSESRIRCLLTRNRPLEAVNAALSTLRPLGLKLPNKAPRWRLILGFLKIALRIKISPIEKLAELPKMTDPEKLAITHILSTVGSAMYMAAPELLPLTTLETFNLSLRYGNAPVSAQTYTACGFLIIAAFGRIETGYRFGKLGMTLLDRLEAMEYAGRTIFLFNYCVRHWKDHVREGVAPLKQAMEIGLKYWDFEFAVRAGTGHHALRYFAGLSLDELERDLDKFCEEVVRLRQEALLELNKLYRQAIANLAGDSKQPSRLVGEHFNEEESQAHFIQSADQSKIFQLSLNKLMLCYLFGEYSEACEQATSVEKSIDGARGIYGVALFYFYDSLARLQALKELDPPLQKASLAKVNSHQKKMRKWAKHAPMNFKHKYLLVEAERSRLSRNRFRAEECYQQAISLAGENRFINEEALANELAGRFHLELGEVQEAKTLLSRACICYERWGAQAKADEIIERYSDSLGDMSHGATAAAFPASSTVSNSGTIEGDLDLAGVLKASQALSDEMVSEKLLTRLMRTVIQVGGGQKGVLILDSNEGFIVRAVVSAGEDGRTELHQTPLDDCPEVPASIVNYVAHTRESLVLSDASRHGDYVADPYVLEQRPKSVLCVPLIHKGLLKGMLYMENNLAADSFTPNRLELLTVLCSQAAISLENARLYQQVESHAQILEQKVTERTEELRQANIELTRQIGLKELASQQLIEASILAESANRAKGEFLANMSHELRTPLNTILGFSELLEDQLSESLSPKHLGFLKHIESSGAHLLQLIDDILDLSKVEAGKMDLNLSAVDTAPLFERSLLMIKERAIRHSLELDLDVSEELQDVRILADEVKLKQIVLNLLSNAAKFTPPGGRIKLSAERNGDRLTISVSDSGIGIRPEDADRVFQPFECVTSESSRQYKGTGLGLTLTRNLVEMHGGRIWLKSDGLGKGSIFTFEIPFIPIDAAKGEARMSRAHELQSSPSNNGQAYAGSGESRTILVVEDDEANMDLVTGILQQAGFRVLQAWAAEEGIEIATQTMPSLILMDVRLPGMDGLSAAGLLKRSYHTKDIPIIAVTAHAMTGDEQKTLAAGCDAYVPKPIKGVELLGHIDRLTLPTQRAAIPG